MSVSGILLGKTMGRGAELATRFDRESENLADLEVRSRMAGRWMMAAIQTSFAVMPALVYLFAGLAPGAASIGTIVAFTTLQTRLFFPVQSLLSRRRRHPDLDRAVRPRLRVPRPDGRHRARDRDAGRRARRGALRRRLVPLRRRVDAARRRHHRRPPARAPRWWARPARARRRSATSRRGCTTPSGARCAIDGTDLRELTFDALADAVGVVSQETYLFHASVRENLRFARPEATDEEIEDAARAAQIHDTIAELPDGYDTVVGERGFRFSGGEKQRIAIARTILRNPPVLVLDEATQRARRRRPSAPSARRSSSSPRAARRSSSPTASRPCATPTRSSSSTAARSPSAAPTRSCSRSAAATPRSSPATKAAAWAKRSPVADLADRGGRDRPVLAAASPVAQVAGQRAQRGARSRARRPTAARSVASTRACPVAPLGLSTAIQ